MINFANNTYPRKVPVRVRIAGAVISICCVIGWAFLLAPFWSR